MVGVAVVVLVQVLGVWQWHVVCGTCQGPPHLRSGLALWQQNACSACASQVCSSACLPACQPASLHAHTPLWFNAAQQLRGPPGLSCAVLRTPRTALRPCTLLCLRCAHAQVRLPQGASWRAGPARQAQGTADGALWALELQCGACLGCLEPYPWARCAPCAGTGHTVRSCLVVVVGMAGRVRG